MSNRITNPDDPDMDSELEFDAAWRAIERKLGKHDARLMRLGEALGRLLVDAEDLAAERRHKAIIADRDGALGESASLEILAFELRVEARECDELAAYMAAHDVA